MPLIIKLDGKIVGVHPDDDAIGALPWFARNKPAYSMDHACKYEGYSVEHVEEIDCHDVAPIIEAICARIGITMEATFVPLSRTKNADTWKSLNWECTFKRYGKEVLTTPYAQGVGFAPSANMKDRRLRAMAIDYECETGNMCSRAGFHFAPYGSKPLPAPRLGDVMHSLVHDCDVLERGGFEDWASDYGYDTDSRSAETTYRACLELALALRSAMGQNNLDELKEVAQYN